MQAVALRCDLGNLWTQPRVAQLLWHFLHVTDRVRVQSITWWIHADIRWFIFELQPALPDSDFSSEEELLPRRAG